MIPSGSIITIHGVPPDLYFTMVLGSLRYSPLPVSWAMGTFRSYLTWLCLNLSRVLMPKPSKVVWTAIKATSGFDLNSRLRVRRVGNPWEWHPGHQSWKKYKYTTLPLRESRVKGGRLLPSASIQVSRFSSGAFFPRMPYFSFPAHACPVKKRTKTIIILDIFL